MQTLFTLFVVAATFAFLLTTSGDAQDRGPSDPRHIDSPNLEKRIAELEGKVSTLGKEVDELHRELRSQSGVAIVPLRHVDAKEAVEVIQEVYGDHPGIEVAVLAQTKTVIVQADKKTKEEIVDLLQKLDVASQGKNAVEQRPYKLKKVISGGAGANRLVFPEHVERAMLLDAHPPARPR